MVAAVTGGAASTPDPQNPKTPSAADARLPFLPSEKDNGNGSSPSNPRKPKSKTVSSRYMSPSTSTPNSSSVATSRRFPSPSVSRSSRNSPSLTPKRSVSVDRRRPAAVTPLTADLDSRSGSAAVISAASKLLVTSTRSLSVSFQGESFSLPVSKTKVSHSTPNPTSMRKGTPERRRTVVNPLPEGKPESSGDQLEKNPKSADHHLWPSRNRAANHLSRSSSKLIGPFNERRLSCSGRLSLDSVERAHDRNLVKNELLMHPYDITTTSDSDSMSSDSTSGVRGSCRVHRSNGPLSIAASARFWQETNSRLRRLQDSSPGPKLIVPAKSKKFMSNGPLLSPVRGNSTRPQSPSKIMVSQPRGKSPSPSRFGEMPSVLSYAVDVRRGKIGENGVLDAHLLRLLYNRHMQWRFVNARAEGVLRMQQRSVKKHLWNAWITISDLRGTVTKKRHRLQLLRQKLKLATILKRETTFLEEWASLDKEHSISLLGAIEALTASTVCLPIVGAIGNVQSMHDAIGSAFDIMQTMAPSVYFLLPMVEKLNSLSSELIKVTTKEQALLEGCTYVLSSLAAMQVKDSSLRTHIIQHARL
ncbi:Protein SNOWY COTYLEDON 3 [Striga hermonthica]|uniref:Protein SNOWY COTYLEDON 3 n=1 Tax=Striga hermonthica TaxID=68872 RepID=A0A9N7MI55_STRHE|nr:Protein SNOWY COTYLEDON 3 [Striga hermonthica]